MPSWFQKPMSMTTKSYVTGDNCRFDGKEGYRHNGYGFDAIDTTGTGNARLSTRQVRFLAAINTTGTDSSLLAEKLSTLRVRRGVWPLFHAWNPELSPDSVDKPGGNPKNERHDRYATIDTTGTVLSTRQVRTYRHNGYGQKKKNPLKTTAYMAFF